MTGDSPESTEGQQRRVREEPEREADHHYPGEYEQFVDFFENAAVPMHWVGPDGTVLHANQAELDALGYSREEYIGHHIAEFHADQHVIDDILDRLSSDEELNDYEARMERKDGSIRHVLIDSYVNWEEGEFVNTRCVTRDITERKERERELQETKSQLQTAVTEKERQNQAFHSFHDIITDSTGTFDQQMHDVLSLGVDFLDLDIGIISNIDPPDYRVEHFVTPDGSIEQGDVLDFSDTFCELVYESEGPIDFRSPAAGGVEDHPCYQDLGLQAYLGEPLVVDGDRYGTLNFSSPSPREEPFTDRERALIRTISEWVASVLSRRHREQVTRQRAESLQAAYEIISTGEGSVSEQIDALLAVARNHIGTDFASFSHIDGDQYEFEAVNVADDIELEAGELTRLGDLPVCERAYQTGQTLVIEDIAGEAPELNDPTWGIACYIGTPVYVGEKTYGTFCFYDVKPKDGGFSDWERTFVELLGDWVGSAIHREQVRERLQRQNERLEAFTSIVSHDLRNPLNVAEGNLVLAQEAHDSEELQAIERAHDRMSELIEDLLTIAREGDAPREFESVELEPLVEKSWDLVETADATIQVEHDGTIQADRSGLEQLVENFIRNAVEHGGDDVTVTVGDLPDGFFVEDDGPGIPPEERDTVLDAGYSTREDGTGLGLHIVHDIAEAHGWDINVAESSNGGARFEFTGVGAE